MSAADEQLDELVLMSTNQLAGPPVFDTSDLGFPCVVNELDHESFFVSDAIEDMTEAPAFLIKNENINTHENVETTASVQAGKCSSYDIRPDPEQLTLQLFSTENIEAVRFHSTSIPIDSDESSTCQNVEQCQGPEHEKLEKCAWSETNHGKNCQIPDPAPHCTHNDSTSHNMQHQQKVDSCAPHQYLAHNNEIDANRSREIPGGMLSNTYNKMNSPTESIANWQAHKYSISSSPSKPGHSQVESAYMNLGDGNIDKQSARMAQQNQRPTRLRYSKGAAPSKYCHVCGRSAKTVAVALCGNNRLGLCRKVVCDKCLIMHHFGDYKNARNPDSSWICTHCRGDCPPRARCHQYQRNNMRRRNRCQQNSQGRSGEDGTPGKVHTDSQSEQMISGKEQETSQHARVTGCSLPTKHLTTDVSGNRNFSDSRTTEEFNSFDEISPTNIVQGALTSFHLTQEKPSRFERLKDETNAYEGFHFM